MSWIDIIGLSPSDTVLGSLDDDSKKWLLAADLIIGSDSVRLEIEKLNGFKGAFQKWPEPFLDIIPMLKKYRGQSVVILATGDPLWYGAGSTLTRYFDAHEMRITPAPSGFQWAASRMAWPLHTTQTLTVHGRPHEGVLKFLQPSNRILILAHDRNSPMKIAHLLIEAGYGEAMLTALGHIGSKDESRHEAKAKDWKNYAKGKYADLPDFHVLAIACPESPAKFLSRSPGLADEAFESDGQLTKAEIRAITLAKLQPQDGGVLWDLGCGSGAIGIEWMRATARGLAIGVDCHQGRLKTAEQNALRLGTPEWQGLCLNLRNKDSLKDLPSPDSVFIGGGLSLELAALALGRLKARGRLVVNAVTLDSEQILFELQGKYGGSLTKIAISRAESIGNRQGWRPLMPVTQWAVVKGG